MKTSNYITPDHVRARMARWGRAVEIACYVFHTIVCVALILLAIVLCL